MEGAKAVFHINDGPARADRSDVAKTEDKSEEEEEEDNAAGFRPRPNRQKLKSTASMEQAGCFTIHSISCSPPNRAKSESSSDDDSEAWTPNYRPRPTRERLRTQNRHEFSVDYDDVEDFQRLASASVTKDCSMCKQPYSGFGATCGSCRIGGHCGSLLCCSRCHTFSSGLASEACEECGRFQTSFVLGAEHPTIS